MSFFGYLFQLGKNFFAKKLLFEPIFKNAMISAHKQFENPSKSACCLPVEAFLNEISMCSLGFQMKLGTISMLQCCKVICMEAKGRTKISKRESLWSTLTELSKMFA